jgi:thiamine biosynthesis protein ThiS
MQLTINGENKEFNGLATIADLAAALALNPTQVAIERNLAIVPRSAYAQTPVAEGDRIEIVQFIGGG